MPLFRDTPDSPQWGKGDYPGHSAVIHNTQDEDLVEHEVFFFSHTPQKNPDICPRGTPEAPPERHGSGREKPEIQPEGIGTEMELI